MTLTWMGQEERDYLVTSGHRTKPRIIGQLEDMRRSISQYHQSRVTGEFQSMDERKRLVAAYTSLASLERYLRDLYGIPAPYTLPQWVADEIADTEV